MAQPLTLPHSAAQRPPRRAWLPTVLIAALLVAVGVVVATWVVARQSRPRATTISNAPLLTLVAPSEVSPTYTLLLLADYPAEQVWQEALRRGDSNSALALWLMGPVRPDRESIADLVVLSQVVRTNDPDLAASLILAAADIARISPELEDRERADLIVGIGKEFEAIGLAPAAVTEWRQASILAHSSPNMPALYRADLLYDLASLYREAGAERLEVQARQAAAQVGYNSGVIIVPDRVLLPTAATLPAEPAELIALRESRRRAAEEAVRQMGTANEATAFAVLNEVLENESRQHRAWMAAQLQAGLPRDEQATLLLYHIATLQRERALAYGYGGQYLANWTARRESIDLTLQDGWNALELVRVDQSIALGVQEQATLAQRDWWATRLVQERLGRDPTLQREAVVAAMLPNNYDNAGHVSLRLDYIQGRFWRVPREYVGTNALPE